VGGKLELSRSLLGENKTHTEQWATTPKSLNHTKKFEKTCKVIRKK